MLTENSDYYNFRLNISRSTNKMKEIVNVNASKLSFLLKLGHTENGLSLDCSKFNKSIKETPGRLYLCVVVRIYSLNM